MKFLVDTQLPPRLSRYFNEKGYDTVHTTDYENGHLLGDPEIRDIAENEVRIVVTKDSDFSDLYFLKGSPPKILLLDVGNISNSDLIQILEEHLAHIVFAFEDGSNFLVVNREEVFRY